MKTTFKFHKLAIMLFVPFSLSFLACVSGGSQQSYTEQQETAADGVAQDPDNKAENDRKFVQEVASSNDFEIAAGKLAVSKGVSGEVKKYGQQMIDDHTAAGTDLKKLTATKGWGLPMDMEQRHQDLLTQLEKASGAAFDALYADIMLASHQEAVTLFRGAAEDAPGVPDADLKKFAQEKLPKLQSHQEHAEQLKKQVSK